MNTFTFKAKTLGFKSFTSKTTGKELFKVDIYDIEKGMISCFCDSKLISKLVKDENQNFIFELNKDKFNSPTLKLVDVQ